MVANDNKAKSMVANDNKAKSMRPVNSYRTIKLDILIISCFTFRCKKSVVATKQFKIAETPNVLVLHLKRFQFGGFIGKLKNQISFPEHFDIATWSKQKVHAQFTYILCKPGFAASDATFTSDFKLYL